MRTSPAPTASRHLAHLRMGRASMHANGDPMESPTSTLMQSDALWSTIEAPSEAGYPNQYAYGSGVWPSGKRHLSRPSQQLQNPSYPATPCCWPQIREVSCPLRIRRADRVPVWTITARTVSVHSVHSLQQKPTSCVVDASLPPEHAAKPGCAVKKPAPPGLLPSSARPSTAALCRQQPHSQP